MSFINKVKNFFYEDVEEDDEEFERREAAKREEKLRKKEEKERKRVEIEETKTPAINSNDNLSERELFKSEKTFNFPMDIGDDIFDLTETMPMNEIKEESRKTVKEEKNIYARPTRRATSTKLFEEKASVETNEPKKFRPSPVVSPVYGILDKNYTVDDVVDTNLSKTKEFSLEKKVVDFDTVRNKAYKELDDEIEKTLTGSKDIFYNLDEEEQREENTGTDDDYIEESYNKDENVLDDVIITYEGESTQVEEPVIEEKQEEVPESVEESEDEYYEVPDVEIPKKQKKGRKKAVKEEVEESEESGEKEDLFNLIDNMYNDEEDEEEED